MDTQKRIQSIKMKMIEDDYKPGMSQDEIEVFKRDKIEWAFKYCSSSILRAIYKFPETFKTTRLDIKKKAHELDVYYMCKDDFDIIDNEKKIEQTKKEIIELNNKIIEGLKKGKDVSELKNKKQKIINTINL